MRIKRIYVYPESISLSENVAAMLELAQEHDAPVFCSDISLTVFPLDSVDSAIQRAELDGSVNPPSYR